MLNVKVKIAPPESVPESNDTGPLVELAVCDAPSLFVQVMESPTSIVRVEGLKAKFWMLTELLARPPFASLTGVKMLRPDIPNNSTIHNTLARIPLTLIISRVADVECESKKHYPTEEIEWAPLRMPVAAWVPIQHLLVAWAPLCIMWGDSLN